MKRKYSFLIIPTLVIIVIVAWQILQMRNLNNRIDSFIEGSEKLMAASYLPMMDGSQPEVQEDYAFLSDESFDYHLRQALTAPSSNLQIEHANSAITEFNRANAVFLDMYSDVIDGGEGALSDLRKTGNQIFFFKNTISTYLDEIEELIDLHREYHGVQYEILYEKYGFMKLIVESGGINNQQVMLRGESGARDLNEKMKEYDSLHEKLEEKMVEVKRGQLENVFQI